MLKLGYSKIINASIMNDAADIMNDAADISRNC